MSSSNIQDIIEQYKTTVTLNIEILKSVVKLSPDEYQAQQDILEKSSDYISTKWLQGRKYLRTAFSMKAFGDLYREEWAAQSIMIDAMINIMDDLLDENLDKNEKVLYMFELVRVLGLTNYNNLDKDFQRALGEYLHKLISLAVLEQIYLKKIQKINDTDEIVELAVELLMSRSKDIDIFIQIPVFYLIKEDDSYAQYMEEIVKAGNVFRALNIVKKDLLDIEHDRSTEQNTIITYLKAKSDKLLETVVTKIASNLVQKFDTIKATDKKAQGIITNFIKMSNQEVDEINKILI